MITLFECWNGGSVQWDRMTPPRFAFAFPAASPELVKFFQLSGRIGEVLTGTDWLLNIGFITIPVALWVNVQTGRADMFNPFMGPIVGQQLLPPQAAGWPGQAAAFSNGSGFVAPPALSGSALAASAGLEVNLTAKGEVHGGGAKSTLESIAKIAEGAGQIASFLSGILPRSGAGNG